MVTTMARKYRGEVARKIFHVSAILLIVLYMAVEHFSSHFWGIASIAAVLALLAFFEYMRIVRRKTIPFVSWFWQLKRASEMKKTGTEVYFVLGALICFAAFDLKIAAAAVLMATFGDIAAALAGKKYGKHWINGLKSKAWEGAAAELAVNLAIGFLFIRTSLWWAGAGSFGQPMWAVIGAMALAATAVETAVQKIPDNLAVPVFSGLAGQIILMLVV